MKIHKSITPMRVMRAIRRANESLDDPGFCLACGADGDGCEPDAEGYECSECGAKAVSGAEQVLMMLGWRRG